MALWLIDRVTLTRDGRQCGRRAAYPLHITGRYAPAAGADVAGRPLSWTVPDVASLDYDLTGAEIEPAAVPFLAP